MFENDLTWTHKQSEIKKPRPWDLQTANKLAYFALGCYPRFRKVVPDH